METDREVSNVMECIVDHATRGCYTPPPVVEGKYTKLMDMPPAMRRVNAALKRVDRWSSYKDIAQRLKIHKDTARIAAREMYRLGKADRIINPENPSQYLYRGKRWAE